MDEMLKIEVNPNDANIILGGLLELPGKVALDTYMRVRQQLEMQMAQRQQAAQPPVIDQSKAN
jgi:hypothetical protein